MGFCMGGALSAAAAALVEEVDAAIVFYGAQSHPCITSRKIYLTCSRAPKGVYLACHFGGC